MMHKLSKLQEHVEMAPYTTMHVGGPTDYFLVVSDVAEVIAACEWADAKNIAIFVLGEGSNVIISDAGLHRLVLKIEIPGFEVVEQNEDAVILEIGAGEHWDSVVERAVSLGLGGIECMSMIPGTTGATPVQNAGAYGQEIADTLVSVDAYDLLDHKLVTLSKTMCEFSYRDSAFKGRHAGRYVITGIKLTLSKRPPGKPTYASLKKYLEEHDLKDPTLRQLREGVMSIRTKILPDPSVVPNSGSFFKNPVVEPYVLERLRRRDPEMPAYLFGDDYKLSAGWLLDACGFKGKELFGLKLYDRHALVITNPNHAGYGDLMKLVQFMQAAVLERFGVAIEPEPQFIK